MKKKLKLVYFEWVDAFKNSGRWFSYSGVYGWAKNNNFWVIQTGFIVEETDKYIILADSFTPPDHVVEATFYGLTKIPKTWIRKKKVLKTIIIEV